MRYLIDTCVLVSALRSSSGASHIVLKAVLNGALPILMHYKLLTEYRSVLFRPEQLHVIPQTENEIERLLAYLVAIATESKVRYLWRPNLSDPSDDFVLEIAVSGQPSTIVTHNTKDFERGNLYFPDIMICSPQYIVREVLNHE
ncbi:MAG TPA: putative toxin-antitoxin system toxin component, PIN family [Desulfuromonadales bacterium]|nr:putative toxin-antitoxin system toxin component, PIN family [Desulfuromonadales bacterium]